MIKTRLIMGMPITIAIIDQVEEQVFESVFNYFKLIDQRFSTYKKSSEISMINSGQLAIDEISPDMQQVFKLAEETKQVTNGFFDIERNGRIDPSGIVKGWAIYHASLLLKSFGYQNFYINCGGDIAVSGQNATGQKWRVGITSPFNDSQIIKVLKATDCGVATSGSYVRGQHIYNPKSDSPVDDIVSLTVIGPNIYEADRFATGAFAMGKQGISFIENLANFEGYLIEKNGLATYTNGFERYL